MTFGLHRHLQIFHFLLCQHHQLPRRGHLYSKVILQLNIFFQEQQFNEYGVSSKIKHSKGWWSHITLISWVLLNIRTWNGTEISRITHLDSNSFSCGKEGSLFYLIANKTCLVMCLHETYWVSWVSVSSYLNLLLEQTTYFICLINFQCGIHWISKRRMSVLSRGMHAFMSPRVLYSLELRSLSVSSCFPSKRNIFEWPSARTFPSFMCLLCYSENWRALQHLCSILFFCK